MRKWRAFLPSTQCRCALYSKCAIESIAYNARVWLSMSAHGRQLQFHSANNNSKSNGSDSNSHTAGASFAGVEPTTTSIRTHHAAFLRRPAGDVQLQRSFHDDEELSLIHI